MSRQTVFINGGMTFETRKDYLEYLENMDIDLQSEETWDEGNYLEKSLKSDLVRVDMPCSTNAEYEEWKITFENYLSKLSGRLVLIGFSLGATFLAKYLSQNNLSQKAISVYLVAPPFDDDLTGEDLAGGFPLNPDLSLLEENCEKLVLLFSENDDVVPVNHAKKFEQSLSEADILVFEDKVGHFQVPEFPELLEKVNEDLGS